MSKSKVMEADVRWKQRFENYEKAFLLFRRFLAKDHLNEFEKQGLIKAFEYTHELAWKVMKDYLEYEGITGITGSRSATREAYNKNLIDQGQLWMDMIESRNKTVHTYLQDILVTEYVLIIDKYFPLFEQFYQKMKSLQ